jgi:uncharacterized membrane protein
MSMGAGHSHGHDIVSKASRRVVTVLGLLLAPFLALTAIGVLVLWPRTAPDIPANAVAGFEDQLVTATAERVTTSTCPPDQKECEQLTVKVSSGPDVGQTITVGGRTLSPGATPTRPGDELVFDRASSPDGVNYTLKDFQRRRSLWALALVSAIVVSVIGRWRGIAAVAGLVVTYAVLVWFVLPAVLAGSNPVAVALVGSSLIMVVVLYLAHGLNSRTTTALLGTLISMVLTGVLSWLFVRVTHLTGTGSEEVMYLTTNGGPALNVTGLLLAGIIIGSLGALNDATVTQASAVWELHASTADATATTLYGSGMRIGRDHIASTVYTIVLAYAGAALPLLLLFTVNRAELGDVANSEIVAEEIVRTLVGSIGLVASVPITTFIAALVVTSDRSAGGVSVLSSGDGHTYHEDGDGHAYNEDEEAVVPLTAQVRQVADTTSEAARARLAQHQARRQAAAEVKSRRPKKGGFGFDDDDW